MIKKKRLVLMLLVMSSAIAWFAYKIHTDINYHQGKDEGYSVRMEMVCALSVIYFVVLGTGIRQRLVFAAAGFFAGIISGILSYIILGGLNFSNSVLAGVIFSILSCTFFMYFFFLTFRFFKKTTARLN